MRNWIFLIIVIFLISCNGQNISNLKHKKLTFKDLPSEIVNYIRTPTEVQRDIQEMLIELPKGKKDNYRLETVKTLIGPWVAYEKLINNDTNVYYKIDQGVPSPYIIFENKLYIPDRYNIFTTVDDLDKVEFTCYELK